MRVLLASLLVLGLSASTTRAEAPHLADVIRPDSSSKVASFQLSVGAGIVERSTVIQAEVPPDQGYEFSGGLQIESEARLFLRTNMHFLNYGFGIRVSHLGSQFLGASGAMAVTTIDALFMVRSLLPCMSSDKLQFYATVFGGVTGAIGRGAVNIGPDENAPERREASRLLRHYGVGGVFGAGAELHAGKFLFGISLNIVRRYSGSGAVKRGIMPSASLRFGVNFEAGGDH